MTVDRYTALWVSHTSISDFLKCPRAYYLKNIYRHPKSNNKIKLMGPPLALGQTVHEVVESLSILPTQNRFDESLITKFERAWEKVEGKLGGFINSEVEQKYKERGREMLTRLYRNPGPLKNLAIKIQMDLPNYWLSEEAGIILCGKIDWLEYLPDINSVHVIDFKTSRFDEDADSLQLPIYHLLASRCQERPVERLSYWYLDRMDLPTQISLPNLAEAQSQILDIAKKIKTARALERFRCPQGDGCYACEPYEKVVNGEAEYVGLDDRKHDIFILNEESDANKAGGIIL